MNFLIIEVHNIWLIKKHFIKLLSDLKSSRIVIKLKRCRRQPVLLEIIIRARVNYPQVNIIAPSSCFTETDISEGWGEGSPEGWELGRGPETSLRSRDINVSWHVPVPAENGHVGNFFFGILSREEIILNMEKIHKMSVISVFRKTKNCKHLNKGKRLSKLQHSLSPLSTVSIPALSVTPCQLGSRSRWSSFWRILRSVVA